MRRLLSALFLLALSTLVLTPAQATHAIDLGAYVQPQGSETNQQAFERFEACCGDLDLTRHYLAQADDWVTPVVLGGFIDWSISQGHHPYVSLHTNTSLTGVTWAQVAAGQYDAVLQDYATQFQASGVPFWFAFHHEPENDTDAGTAAEFKAASIHVYDVMKPLCPSCQIGTTLMRGTFTGAHGGYAAWLPDAAHLDFVGADIYANNGTSSLSSLTGPVLTVAQGLGKPLFIGESGCAGTGSQKKVWLTAARTYLKAHTDIVGFDYSETVFGTFDYRVETTTAAKNAWKAITGDPYFQ